MTCYDERQDALGGKMRKYFERALSNIIKHGDTDILIVAKTLFETLKKTTQERISEHTVRLIKERSHVLQPELNLAYAIRLIAASEGSDKEEVLNRVYAETRSSLIRTDIILTMAKWRASYWLSDLRTKFRTLGPSEKRAFIIASYVLTDEGDHWRDDIRPEPTL